MDGAGGGGEWVTFCRFDFGLESTFPFSSRWSISGVAIMVSPRSILYLPDCRHFLVVCISLNSDNSWPCMRFRAKLRFKVRTNRTTWVRAGVSKGMERSCARCLISVLARVCAGVSIGEDVRSGFRNGDSNSGVDRRGGDSTGRGRGTWDRTIRGLKGRRPVPDHPLAIFFAVKAKGRALIKAVSHSAFSMRGKLRTEKSITFSCHV